MHPLRREDDVETVQFPTPQRRRRRHYAPARSPHSHWAWIGALFLGTVLLGTVVLFKAPALFWPVIVTGNFVLFFAVLYGVIRSATR